MRPSQAGCHCRAAYQLIVPDKNWFLLRYPMNIAMCRTQNDSEPYGKSQYFCSLFIGNNKSRTCCGCCAENFTPGGMPAAVATGARTGRENFAATKSSEPHDACLRQPCMTELYLHCLCAHYGLPALKTCRAGSTRCHRHRGPLSASTQLRK